MPPGPWSLPLIGMAPWINQEAPHIDITKLSKRYGDIMSMTLIGIQKVLVVSSEEAIKDVLINKQRYFSGSGVVV